MAISPTPAAKDGSGQVPGKIVGAVWLKDPSWEAWGKQWWKWVPQHKHGSLNAIEHHPTIRYMVYNGYYKVMSNIPKMGHLPTSDKETIKMENQSKNQWIGTSTAETLSSSNEKWGLLKITTNSPKNGIS